MSASPLIYTPGQAQRPRGPRLASGRKVGKPHGSHIADLVALRKAILLCGGCKSKFAAKASGYYAENRFGVISACDACRVFGQNVTLHVHESTLTGPRGQDFHGASWMPG